MAERITDDQMMMIARAIDETATTGNFVAQAIQKSVATRKTTAEKWAVIATAYGQMFALMTAIQMALDSKVPYAEFARRMDTIKAKK